MNKSGCLILSVAFFAAMNTASAAERACLIEDTLSIMGITETVKDCLESAELPLEELTSMCQGLADTGASVARSVGGTANPKVTWLSQCPTGAQGSCQNLMKSKANAYYYARTEDSLQDVAKGCEALGGKWQ